MELPTGKSPRELSEVEGGPRALKETWGSKKQKLKLGKDLYDFFLLGKTSRRIVKEER